LLVSRGMSRLVVRLAPSERAAHVKSLSSP
jgi:hypothetical protein